MDFLLNILKVIGYSALILIFSALAVFGAYMLYVLFKALPQIIKYRKEIREIERNYNDITKVYFKDHPTVQ